MKSLIYENQTKIIQIMQASISDVKTQKLRAQIGQHFSGILGWRNPPWLQLSPRSCHAKMQTVLCILAWHFPHFFFLIAPFAYLTCFQSLRRGSSIVSVASMHICVYVHISSQKTKMYVHSSGYIHIFRVNCTIGTKGFGKVPIEYKMYFLWSVGTKCYKHVHH